MTFEFMYGKTPYTYIDGHVFKKLDTESSVELCPVPIWCKELLEWLPEEQFKAVLCSIVLGYNAGVANGKKAKIKEFKSMFNIH